MRQDILFKISIFHTVFILAGLSHFIAYSQENTRQSISFEDYTEGFVDAEDTYFATLEEWQAVIQEWLESPLCINSEEADWLVDYKIISLYQLNKLKEYRLMYGNLLSVYETGFIEGWDFQTVRKVLPLVTVELPKSKRVFKKFDMRSISQGLIVKTSFNTIKSKGYRTNVAEDPTDSGPFYTGPPLRLTLRYDLEYRKRIALGLRMEKDAGEPLLLPASQSAIKIKAPDLVSGFLLIKRIGPVHSIILGNYRVNFGYGLNLAGSMTGIKGRNGIAGMADRISPQTSVSETGFFRGIALRAEANHLSITGFASHQDLDGTSVNTDSITGRPVSFSSLNNSGLHRSATELAGRKSITEKIFGGFLVFSNNWLKAGIISVYNHFNAQIAAGSRPYARFGLTGKENIVTGFSCTIWLPKIQWLSELSVSKNSGKAILSGIQLNPVPGINASVTCRKFDATYQNWHGSGFLSAGKNADESGIQVKLRTELPKKYLVEIIADISKSEWISFDLASPSRQRELKVMAEKAWIGEHSINLIFSNKNTYVKDPENSEWICHPAGFNQYRIRLEGRFAASDSVRLKSRIELNFSRGGHPGWLIFQDLEIFPGLKGMKSWLRVCFFDISNYENRIYSYENGVLYDFSSFMHYGKGLRGILMFSYSPVNWLDLWLRASTVYYTNKNIGTGWDETGENRQIEFEIQARLRFPG